MPAITTSKSSSTLKTRIVKGVKLAQESGLIPTAIVMDQGSNNMSALKQLGITKRKPFFFVNGSKIYVIFDPPHLMKNIRNNLKKLYGIN